MVKLYEDLAFLWPVLSPPADYAPEASLVLSYMLEHLPARETGAKWSVLELGAGGGHTLFHLGGACECVAVDLSDAMLAQCRVLNPEVHTIEGDMRTLDLFQAFDAVLLHDAADYLRTEDDARAAIATAAKHLDPGGLFVLMPTYVTESFEDGESAEDANQTDDLSVRYQSTVQRTGEQAFALTMSIAWDGPAGEGQAEDVHECGLFGREDWRAWLLDGGFEVSMDEPEDGPGVVFVGVRQ